jgi:hypothetical protein
VEKPDAAPLLILYVLALLSGLALVLATVAFDLKVIPIALPPALQKIWPWRSVVIGAIFFLALLLLFLQMAIGTSLESKVQDAAHKRAEQFGPSKAITDEEVMRQEIREGEFLGAASLRRTFWLRLVVFLNVLLVLGALLQFWLERRGQRPAPHIDLVT